VPWCKGGLTTTCKVDDVCEVRSTLSQLTSILTCPRLESVYKLTTAAIKKNDRQDCILIPNFLHHRRASISPRYRTRKRRNAHRTRCALRNECSSARGGFRYRNFGSGSIEKLSPAYIVGAAEEISHRETTCGHCHRLTRAVAKWDYLVASTDSQWQQLSQTTSSG
jgi:hypothetical protein